MQSHSPESEDQRRSAVALAVALTSGTLAPQRYERQLLARYERGELSIEQIIALLEASTYRVLYHSRATQPLTEEQLHGLLERSRAYNARHHITGLLLYSDGRFVQMLEGAEDMIKPLYARIQQDSRHTQVVTVSAGEKPARRFTEWSMGFGHIAPPQLEQALEVIEAQQVIKRLSFDEPRLYALLQAFGITA